MGIKSFFVKQDLYRTFDKDFGVKYTPKGVLNFCVKKIKTDDNILIPQQGFYISKWKNDNQYKHKVENQIILVDYLLIHKVFELWNGFPNFLIKKVKLFKKIKDSLF